jgi:hypothetical protein
VDVPALLLAVHAPASLAVPVAHVPAAHPECFRLQVRLRHVRNDQRDALAATSVTRRPKKAR